MKKDILKGIIRDFHVEPLADFIDRDIDLPDASGKIIALTGVRRSGKTSLLLNFIAGLVKKGFDKRKVLYLNFEDERLDLNTGELDLILQAYRELYPDLNLKDCYLFFDEIQNIAGWEKFVRRVYDSTTKNIFITGSNSRFLSSDIATSLRGRSISCEVFPLSFKEHLRFHNVAIDRHSSRSQAMINNHLQKYLVAGGFPEVIRYDDKLRDKVLQEYFNVMIYRDLIERYEIKNQAVLKFFIKRLLVSATKQLSINTIYNDLKSSGIKIGKNYLYDYLEACQNVYLAFVLNKFSYKVVSRELGDRKVYAIDNGLLNAISFQFSDDKGKAMEQSVFLELKRRGAEVYFFKERYECDFVVKKGSAIAGAIQVSYSLTDEKTKRREIRGLVDACKVLGLTSGVIITNDIMDEFAVEKIKVRLVPPARWLLGDDSEK